MKLTRRYLGEHVYVMCVLVGMLCATGCGGNDSSSGSGDMAASSADGTMGDGGLVPADAGSTDAAMPTPADGAVADAGAPSNAWHEDCPMDVREQRMMDVGEVRLNVACRGAGPTIVFLHGFPEFHYGWHPVMDALAAEFRLVAPDQRGYNLSDKPEDVAAYELPKLTQDILRLLPLISAEPVILVAHDWGGPVGWLVAHTPGAHIRGFMSTNGPPPLHFADLIANNAEHAEASSYMNLFRSAAAEQFMTPEALAQQFSFLSPEVLAVYQEAWAQPGAITGGLNWYRANDLDPTAGDALMAGRSPTVPVPTMVLWGLDDEFVLAVNAEGLERYAPDIEVQTFPGVDHWIAHRIPGEIAQAIRTLHMRTMPGAE